MEEYKVFQAIQWLLKQDPQAILTIEWDEVKNCPSIKVTKEIEVNND